VQPHLLQRAFRDSGHVNHHHVHYCGVDHDHPERHEHYLARQGGEDSYDQEKGYHDNPNHPPGPRHRDLLLDSAEYLSAGGYGSPDYSAATNHDDPAAHGGDDSSPHVPAGDHHPDHPAADVDNRL
jgi:hypothetical protein